jgi:dihydrofolate synthase/folylpolyglutamate synthase
MDYQETLEYLYHRLPVFQNIGARAFKPGLTTTRDLCQLLGNPQNKYPTIHVGGTNGKGSTSHMLAAILQQSGYKVGLYTSPHLKDFRERIRINGIPVEEQFIVDFTTEIKSNIDRFDPSFFEVTVAMAFSYFAQQSVDIAVIEVGMGGRLDSTNVIQPVISVITNVSLDHTQFLGSTLPEIAREKAGIIKENTPTVISEYQGEGISDQFIAQADNVNAPIYFGSKCYSVQRIGEEKGKLEVEAENLSKTSIAADRISLDLTGSYQTKNLAGVLTATDLLKEQGWKIGETSVKEALASVVSLTGLKGRWQQLGVDPLIYCDTAHNAGGLTDTIAQFQSLPHRKMRFVIGFVKDKDITSILHLFPKNASYYFCEPGNMRAMKAADLALMSTGYGLNGPFFSNVNEALSAAIQDSSKEDVIYVGGSTFVVADLDQL